MKESVKDFIENNIVTLDEGNIDLFLYLASMQLNKQDVNILCSFLDIAKIEYKSRIPMVVEEILKDNIALQYRGRIKLSDIINSIPQFNITDHPQVRKIVKDAITKVYPDRFILPDKFTGIEYVREKLWLVT